MLAGFRRWRLRRALAANPTADIVPVVAQHLTDRSSQAEAAELLGRTAFDMAWQVMRRREGEA